MDIQKTIRVSKDQTTDSKGHIYCRIYTPISGKNYQIKIITKQKSDSIQLSKEEFTIKLQSSRSSRKIVQNLYENWLAKKANGIFDKKISKFSKRL